MSVIAYVTTAGRGRLLLGDLDAPAGLALLVEHYPDLREASYRGQPMRLPRSAADVSAERQRARRRRWRAERRAAGLPAP